MPLRPALELGLAQPRVARGVRAQCGQALYGGGVEEVAAVPEPPLLPLVVLTKEQP